MFWGYYKGVSHYFPCGHEHAHEFQCISQVYSLKIASYLSKTLLCYYSQACSQNQPIFCKSAQVNKSAIISKCHNFLILSPIFVIHTSLESSLSLLSNSTTSCQIEIYNLSYHQKTKQRSRGLEPENFSTSIGYNFFILYLS